MGSLFLLLGELTITLGKSVATQLATTAGPTLGPSLGVHETSHTPGMLAVDFGNGWGNNCNLA